MIAISSKQEVAMPSQSLSIQEVAMIKDGQVRQLFRLLNMGTTLSEGLQNALWELGGTPHRHRSDSLSAAVNNLSEDREFQQRYRDLLAYYGLEVQRINVRQAHENGDVESSHRHFKNAVDQALRLRGSRDFTSP